MKSWLMYVLGLGRELLAEDEAMQGWVLGRGISERLMDEMVLGKWPRIKGEYDPAPNEEFRERYGTHGQALVGSLVIPLWSPRGSLLGVHVRGYREKKLTRHMLPESKWNPVFFGLTRSAMERIWAGGAVWLGEGDFDMGALDQATPKTDVALGCLTAKLSYPQVAFCRRFVRGGVNMAFDNDEAGHRGMHDWTDDAGKRVWGGLSKLAHVGVECRAVSYRGGKDPGEIWENTGTEGLKRALRIM